MELTEALLIAIIIILVVVVITNRKGGEQKTEQKAWDCVDRDTGSVTAVKLQYSHPAGCSCPGCSAANPESMSLSDNAEHFAACGSTGSDTNECDDKFGNMAENFNGSGESYKDLVTSMSVDPQTLRNHADFVKDRVQGQNQHITGRTYAIADEIEMDSTPWQGIRGRPQLIPGASKDGPGSMGNPTQVPDVRYSSYTVKPRFNWNSSPY